VIPGGWFLLPLKKFDIFSGCFVFGIKKLQVSNNTKFTSSLGCLNLLIKGKEN
jgi:hypothetical protein